MERSGWLDSEKEVLGRGNKKKDELLGRGNELSC
jgi:hypothetical protein